MSSLQNRIYNLTKALELGLYKDDAEKKYMQKKLQTLQEMVQEGRANSPFSFKNIRFVKRPGDDGKGSNFQRGKRVIPDEAQ